MNENRFIGDKFFKKEATISRRPKVGATAMGVSDENASLRNAEEAQVAALREESEHFDPLGSYTGGGNERPTQDADDL